MHQHNCASRRSRRRSTIGLLVPLVGALNLGCNDSPVASPPEPNTTSSHSTPTPNISAIRELANHVESVARDPVQSRVWRATVASSTGRVDTLTAQEYAGYLRGAVRRADAASVSHPVPADDSIPLTIRGSSRVEFTPSTVVFRSITTVNKLTDVNFVHDANWDVSVLHGRSVRSAREVDTRTTNLGIYDTKWPLSPPEPISISQGCSWMGTISTLHTAKWPWGFLVPKVSVQTRAVISVGADSLVRPCSPTPPVITHPDEPPCEDMSACKNQPGGGGPSGGSFPVSSQVALTQGSVGSHQVLVCWVTDWYDSHGSYIETYWDVCWTETR